MLIFLLVVIAAVLLFGRNFVLAGLGIGAAIAAVGFVLLLLFAMASNVEASGSDAGEAIAALLLLGGALSIAYVCSGKADDR
jgi:hypothetical protein